MKHCFNENDIGRVQLSYYTMNLIHTSDVTFTRNNVQKKKQKTLSIKVITTKKLYFMVHITTMLKEVIT